MRRWLDLCEVGGWALLSHHQPHAPRLQSESSELGSMYPQTTDTRKTSFAFQHNWQAASFRIEGYHIKNLALEILTRR